MSNYLPVLLISVNNAVPDDAAVATLPRGQVDYLSHDWREEDVWRSWREMTRQKNDIANGARLENASWRTWWKQRNGLPTISPETLNWLKDSDVTWLYGPLHTLDDWKHVPSPPKDHATPAIPGTPDTLRSSASSSRLATATAAFDPASVNKSLLSVKPGAGPSVMNRVHSGSSLGKATKPILKHRSVMDLLTSALPVGGALERSAAEEMEAEVEASGMGRSRSYSGYTDVGVGSSVSASGVSVEGGAAPRSSHSRSAMGSSPPSSSSARRRGLRNPPKRPPLTHTHSESTIDGQRHLNPFRRASPPRVVAPAGASSSPTSPSTTASDSASVATPSSAAALPLRRASSSGGSAGSSDRSRSIGRSSSSNKKRHITFNTFVEQCIAIDTPKEVPIHSSLDASKGAGFARYLGLEADHGYEEDTEGYSFFEVSPETEDMQLFGSELSPARRDKSDPGSDSDDEDDDEDEALEMRRSPSVPSFRRTRSRSTSSSTSPPHPQTPSARSPKLRYMPPTPHAGAPVHGRPPLIRNSTSDGSADAAKEHVSIAAIAPTMLKTGPTVLNEAHPALGFAQDDGLDGWFERKGRVEGGLGSRRDKKKKRRRRSDETFRVADAEDEEEGEDEAVDFGEESVELVYSPPVGSNYNPGHPAYHFGMPALPVPSIGIVGPTPSRPSFLPDLAGTATYHHTQTGVFVHSPERSSPLRESSVPVDNETLEEGDERLEDVSSPYDYFGGPDLGEDFAVGRRKAQGGPVRYAQGGVVAERSSSVSNASQDDAALTVDIPQANAPRSATPSIPVPIPRGAASPSTPSMAMGNPTSPALLSPPSSFIARSRQAGMRRTSSSPSSLSPHGAPSPSAGPARGRPDAVVEGGDRGERGRSLTRTSSFSDREHSREGRSRSSSRNNSASSPIGSLSPSGSRLGNMGLGAGIVRRGSTDSSTGSFNGREERGRPSAVRRVSGDGVGVGGSVASSGSPPAAKGKVARTAVAATPYSPTIPEIPPSSIVDAAEEEARRSAHPTPASSPTAPTFKHRPSASASSVVGAVGAPPRAKGESPRGKHANNGRRHTRIVSSPVTMPTTGGGAQQDESGLITRAVEIVSSARGYLGSLWGNPNGPGAVATASPSSTFAPPARAVASP